MEEKAIDVEKNYSAFQLRVIEEKAELDDKIERLSNFLQVDHDIAEIDIQLLSLQLQTMSHYSAILSIRIKRF